MGRALLVATVLLVGCGGVRSAPPAPPAPPASPTPPAPAPDVGAAAPDRGPRVEVLRALAADSRGDEQLDVQHALFFQLAMRDDDVARAEALAVLEAMAANPAFATWPRADIALYDLGARRAQARDRAGARVAWRRLIADHPVSNRVPDAHLALADAAFEDGDLAAARAEYQAVLRTPAADGALYARYKLGWVELNLGDQPAALAAFLAVARAADQPLRGEAIKDVVRVYAAIGDPAAAPAFFDALDRGRGPALTLRLAEACLDVGRLGEAAVALRVAIPLLDVDGACRAAGVVGRLEAMLGPTPAVAAARAALADWRLADDCLAARP